MQQEQGSENKTNNDRDDQESSSISPITGTAIAIWVFGIGGAILWFVIHDNIADTAKSFEVFIASIFSLALVIVVVIQAGIYFRQARALDAQLELSRKAVRYSEAAYITVNRAEISKRPIIGQITEAWVEFINSGNTPAYEVRMYLHFGIRPEGFMFTREEAVAIEGSVSSAVMGGRGATLKQEVQSTNPLTQGVLDTVSKDNQYIHIWGLVLYKDVFKRDRWTRFSMALPNLLATLFIVAPTCNDAGGED